MVMMVNIKKLLPLYAATLDQLNDTVFWFNDSYHVIYASGQQTNAMGLHINQVVLNAEQESWIPALTSMNPQGEEPKSVNGYLLDSKDGSFKENMIKIIPFVTGEDNDQLNEEESSSHPCWLVICEDPKRLRLQRELESKTVELTAELSHAETMNLELARNAQTKDEFLASMSHELRTPLNAILGLCEAMLEGVYGNLDPDQYQPIRQVFSNGHHLLSVISDILDLSKLRAGGISLSLGDIDVEACCFEALQVFRTEMQRKHLAVSVSIEGVYLLNADERWFKQVLMNLISNAVKFTKPNQRLGITVGLSPNSGYLRVTVWDEGIGISQENLPRLFQTFVQLDNSLERAYEGTGLGLSIVSQVMSLHGGDVKVDSVLNEGSKFHLDFPWVDASESEHVVEEYPEQDLKSVLLVEDSTIDADRIKRYLKEKDTDVIWDQRGGDAVKLAKDHQPDVIILDLFLPESSGWEILKQLKSDPSLQHMPVVVCSVLPRDNNRSESPFIDGYLQKPFSRRALENVLKQATRDISKTNSIKSDSAEGVTKSGDIEGQSKDELDPPKKALVISASEAGKISKPVKVSLDSSSKLSSIKGSLHYPTPTDSISSPKCILVVDDNLSNIQLVQDYLGRKGYQILTAEDGYQAVQIARAHTPDLILMDVQMPHMSGIEATAHIRDDPRIASIPIFALTALAMPGDRERCLEAGMDEYFTKPVSLRGLYKKIKSTIEDAH